MAMRLMPRMLSGLVLAGGLILLPAGGGVQAASVGHTTAGVTPSRTGVMITGTGRFAVFMSLENLATVEGVSADVLQQDLQADETLLQISGTKYSSASDLATALLANLKRKLDSATAAGKFTAADESQQYAALLSATERLVVTPHPQLVTDPYKAGTSEKVGANGQVAVNSKLMMITTVAASCNTTSDALVAALDVGGKSILQVCQTTNPNATVESLSAAVMAAIKAQFDAAVSSGKMTAGEESQGLAALQAQLPAMLTTPVTIGRDNGQQKG